MDTANSRHEKSTDQTNASNGSIASPSALYPIQSEQLRTKNYLIGYQDSAFGNDEFKRYFPDGKLSLYVVTWNMSSRKASNNLQDLLLPTSVENLADIYVIGIQEAPFSNDDETRKWETCIQATLGPSHVPLSSSSLGVLHITMFIRRELIWFCTIPESSGYNTRHVAANRIKTKGGLGLSFAFFGTSFLFINSHLPAHVERLRMRIEEYDKICASLTLPKNLLPLKARYLSKDVTERFDCVFWFGDLNFRVEKPAQSVLDRIEEVSQRAHPSYDIILQSDQLCRLLKSKTAFDGFQEAVIHFPPSYKFLHDTNKYDISKERSPSYTDRILFRTKRPNHTQCIVYDLVMGMTTSDHKPVCGLFESQIRPGLYVNAANAGQFKRDIYIDGLKKRAEDLELGLQDSRGASLICNIM